MRLNIKGRIAEASPVGYAGARGGGKRFKLAQCSCCEKSLLKIHQATCRGCGAIVCRHDPACHKQHVMRHRQIEADQRAIRMSARGLPKKKRRRVLNDLRRFTALMQRGGEDPLGEIGAWNRTYVQPYNTPAQPEEFDDVGG